VVEHTSSSHEFKSQYEQQQKKFSARHWCVIPVILATQEAEMRRIVVQSQPRKIVHKTLS
jgi:hypothetical protein